MVTYETQNTECSTLTTLSAKTRVHTSTINIFGLYVFGIVSFRRNCFLFSTYGVSLVTNLSMCKRRLGMWVLGLQVYCSNVDLSLKCLPYVLMLVSHLIGEIEKNLEDTDEM